MVTKQQVITPERFASALTYQQFIDQMPGNHEEFKDNYDNTTVPADLKARLQAVAKKPNGPKKLLVLGEHWCPDVYRGLPVLQRLADAAGIEMRSLFRDQNLDIMNQYLNKGEFQSIPCALFLTDDLDVVMVWHERPDSVTADMPKMRAVIGDRSREEAAEDLKAFRRGPVWGFWRTMTIADITDKLEAAVK